MIFVLALVLAAAPARVSLTETASVSERWIDAVVAGRDRLPSLDAVQRAAVEALELPDREIARSWSSRARWRGLLPRLEASLGTDSDLDVRDSISSSTRRTTSEGQAFGARISARFELGELVFNDAELRANREALARASAAQLARERVTQIYFERVEVLAAQRTADSTPLRVRGAFLDGLLEAHTGGLLPKQGERE
jgi:hypothetical protein